ncbi:hypothetical protein TNIN_172421 [Trichonephila inaurata madagascariensis]|uniref:Uncharacterized protein n=1 Tax=Trichonephila inaurata madagascariensis TaxID=2747483 RepID=A0A8X7CNI1_9ARAC|nr:hypothetical protein TNIN_172421 [Trichonephila inaurata madagascariensis]
MRVDSTEHCIGPTERLTERSRPEGRGVVRRTSTAWGVRGPDRGATVRDEAGRTEEGRSGGRGRGDRGGLERVGIGPTGIGLGRWELDSTEHCIGPAERLDREASARGGRESTVALRRDGEPPGPPPAAGPPGGGAQTNIFS